MNTLTAENTATKPWQEEIRSREDEARVAFLHADIATLDKLFADSLTVNSPLQKLMTKPLLFDALRAGRIRHLENEAEIEYMSRYDDIVIVMGNDRVVDPPDRALSLRRYTNIWRHENGAWRMIARHAHVVSREAGR